MKDGFRKRSLNRFCSCRRTLDDNQVEQRESVSSTVGSTTFLSNSLFDFGISAKDYEQWYRTPQGRIYDRIQKRDVLTFLSHPQWDKHLLDVGCGTGHWSMFFGSLGYKVVGVDISHQMIDVARNHCATNCFFQVSDACHLPFKDQCFDIVTTMATLEFVSDVQHALEEMFRCVKEDGCVLIGTLNRLAPINQQRLAEGREPYASGYLRSPDELHALLKRFGSVRMVASSPSANEPGNLLTHRISPDSLPLRGPFIIAEVKR
ncbi:MAG: class I SAM-dependent methyltransferase [Candidatus Omnitrophota bacterium]|jgi:ubiquinone/menaquinone biosynthesis C-methylase UbiE|nr:MAG: class I SAM-dependent methyltransferase [Candidatus Omnitrophota bacterium]